MISCENNKILIIQKRKLPCHK